MGLWGKIKGGIKKVGKFARKAAPALAFIPGVGTLAAAGIGAAGGLIGGEGFGGAAKGALGGAAGGLGKAALGKFAGGGGLSAALKGGGMKGGIKAVGSAAKGGGGFLGGLGGVLGKVGQLALDRPELVLGGIGAVQNAHAQSRFEGQQQQARDFSQAQMAQQQAIQKAILDRIMNRQPQNFGVDLSDPGNPFTRGAA